MKKQKFLSEKKLVKTTTIAMVLLIATTLISSSAVSVTFGDNTTTINKEAGNMLTISANTNNLLADLAPISGSPYAGDDPGDVLWTMDVEAITGDIRLLGVEVTDDEHIWLTGARDYTPGSTTLYELDFSGTLLNQWPQPAHCSGWGWRDLAFDGTYLYASVGYNIDEIDPATGQWTGNTIPGPITPCRALAYDPATDHFWTASFTSLFYEIDRTGAIINSYANPWGGAYGMAWDDISPGGPFLWVHDQYGSGTDIHQIDPSTGTHTGVTWSYTQGVAGGAAVIAKDGFVQFVGLTQGAPDEIFGIELASAGPPPDHDLGVASIPAPTSGPAAGAITPEVTVKNYGNNSETTDVQLTIGSGVPGTIFFIEDFSGGVPPAGWSTDVWIQSFTANAGGTSPEARVYWLDMSGFDYSYISSIPTDTTSASQLEVEFKSKIDDYSGGYDCFVKSRADATDPWTDITPWSNPISGNVGPGTYIVDITADIGTGTEIMWEYIGPYFNTDWWDIDDVELRTPSSYVVEYDQTVTGVTVGVGETVDVTFPDWTPADWQVSENVDIDYDIDAYTLLVDDNPANNHKDKVATLHYPFLHDIAVVSINDPVTSGPAQTLPVEVTIKNVGQFPECCYKTNVQIGEKVMTNMWYQILHSGTGEWEKTDRYSYVRPTYYTGNYMVADSDYHNTDVFDVEIFTSSMDLSGETSVDFFCYYRFQDYAGKGEGAMTLYSAGVLEDQFYYSDVDDSGTTMIYNFDPSGYTDPSDVQIGFWYSTQGGTYAWGFGVDTISVTAGTTTFMSEDFEGDFPPGFFSVVTEYDEDVCTIVLDPGESADLTFPDWTPDALGLGISGDRHYDVTAVQQLSTDTNPLNDQISESFTLEYWHDVLVKDVVPSIGGRGDEWLQYDTGVYSNAFGSTSNEIWGANRFTPTELAPYDGWYLTTIKWSNYAPSAVTGEVIVYDGGTPTAPGPILVADPISETGAGWYEYTLSSPVLIDASKDIWLCIHVTHAASEYPMECSLGGILGKTFWFSSDGTAWLDVVGYGYDVAVMIRGLVTEGGAPGAQVYVPLGSQAISAVIENTGVFPETGLTASAKIYEYITNETVGTLVWEANVTGIDLDPFGGQQACDFGSYNFAIEGIYKLVIKCELTSDDYPDNNEKGVGIGADDTAPTSDHTVVPGTPDGDNGWYVSDVTVSFTADDGTEAWQSGVDHIEYKVDGGTPQTGDSVTLTADGDHDVEYRAVDNVGNVEAWNPVPTISIDQTAPVIDLTWEASGGDVIFTATCSDATSGMDRVEFFMNDALSYTDDAEPYEWVVEWSSALELVMFKATAYDAAGNSDFDELDGGDAVSQMQSQTTPVVRQRQTNSL